MFGLLTNQIRSFSQHCTHTVRKPGIVTITASLHRFLQQHLNVDPAEVLQSIAGQIRLHIAEVFGSVHRTEYTGK